MRRLTRIRPAQADDYDAFARLFLELGTGDPVVDQERFVADLVPTTLIADDETGSALGYVYFQLLKDVAFVRHLVAAPEARRRGVARGLLHAVRDRAGVAGCHAWCLNVKPDNAAALELYESIGMARAFESWALELAWQDIERQPVLSGDSTVARRIDRGDDLRVESAMQLLSGELAEARTTPDRVLVMLEQNTGAVLGAAIFHPHFPGARPFRVARPELAWPLLRALRPFARATDLRVHVMIENQPAVADLLIAGGAMMKTRLLNLKGLLATRPDQRAD